MIVNEKMGRMDHVFEHAKILPITQETKYILISDCHRGVGSSNDNFLKNQNVYFAALTYYYQNGFHYIELGDGEELWENRHYEDIKKCHSNVYWLFHLMEQDKKITRLYGNHNFELCENMSESAILFNGKCHIKIYLTHGHQVDLLNCDLWHITRFLVRYLWRPLEQFGINDPTSAAKNNEKQRKIEQYLNQWAKNQNGILICGHTHRPQMLENGRYYNTGSCVHPRCITGIEIQNLKMTLVKWTIRTKEDMSLFVAREVLAGPFLIPSTCI